MKKLFIISFVAALLAACVTQHRADDPMIRAKVLAQETILEKRIPTLDPKVLRLALLAYYHARATGLDSQEELTIIDFSKPDTQERFWVVDLRHDKVQYHSLVSHGENSGGVAPTEFSDEVDSKESSIGLFKTGKPYKGTLGYSLHLYGLEKGVNGNAFKRHIVIHGAPYVSKQYVHAHGFLGRSWGCPALPEKLVKPVINTIKNGSLIFAYYPDSDWLHHSRYLN